MSSIFEAEVRNERRMHTRMRRRRRYVSNSSGESHQPLYIPVMPFHVVFPFPKLAGAPPPCWLSGQGVAPMAGNASGMPCVLTHAGVQCGPQSMTQVRREG